MKIALHTWYHHRNYGTALQVTALSHMIRTLGYEVDLVKYIPMGYYRSGIPYGPGYIVSRLGNKFRKPPVQYPAGHHFCDFAKEQKFAEFLGKHVSMTQHCETMSDLEGLNTDYDAFVCGSDQIWSPLVFDPHYYLDFVHDPEKLVAYAPSLGSTEIKDPYIRARIQELAGRFRHLSVRETQGKALLQKLTGKEVFCAADPTLLLDVEQWEKLVPQVGEDEAYLLVYMLGTQEYHWEMIHNMADTLRLPIRIIPVFEEDLTREGCIQSPVGPEEFVQLMRNATYICTDSFHGTIFSILHHKPFSLFERFAKDDPRNQNSRIHSLLEKLGLTARLLKHTEDIPRQALEEINYMAVEECRTKMVQSSVDYLKTALKQATSAPKKEQRVVTRMNTLCCGCGQCRDVCPTNAIILKKDTDGFLQANILTEKCVSCGMCTTVCPFVGEQNGARVQQCALYAYKDYDPQVLLKSSSGGFAHRLSGVLMEQGYAIVGCTYDRTEQRAKHILITEPNELSKLQGSKYLQSDFGAAFADIEQHTGPIVIFGTPCQITAVRKRYYNRDNLIFVDLICHGIPSDLVLKNYQRYLSSRYGLDSNQQSNFRYKPKGWHEKYLYTEDGQKECCFHESKDPFFQLFEVGNCYAKSCYECRWRDRTDADIRIGDYWGPRFEQDNTGVSMVLGATPIGNQLIQMLCPYGELQEEPIEDALKYQQTKNVPRPAYYEELMEKLAKPNARLDILAEKYAVPMLMWKYPLTKKERIVHAIKVLMPD